VSHIIWMAPNTKIRKTDTYRNKKFYSPQASASELALNNVNVLLVRQLWISVAKS